MKNQSVTHIFFGIASGLFIWVIYELLLQLITANFSRTTLISGFGGIVLGLCFGIAVSIKDGIFFINAYKVKRGVFFGGIFGICGGVVAFVIIELVYRFVITQQSSFSASLIVTLFQWLVLSIAVGIGISVRDSGSTIATRSAIVAAGSGIIGGVAFIVASYFIHNLFWARGIGLLCLTISFSILSYYATMANRQSWLKSLNGKLEGIDFELTKEIHYLGTQSNDDINLRSYQEIRPSHAKLVRYHSGYSIVDNDPFWQTFVNFRNIREQPLKNGDIIKIGQALFQYCMAG